jgi:Reverse transcriptase (RNA-dependent DNA polymerase)
MNNSINLTVPKGALHTPIELFSRSGVAPNFRFEHPFGCPAYILDKNIQSGFKAGKWESRSRLGIYLGSSEFYAPSISLILSLSTGMVSPQFHVKHDDQFHTVSAYMGAELPKSEWQTKCHFITRLHHQPRFTALHDIQLAVPQNYQPLPYDLPDKPFRDSEGDTNNNNIDTLHNNNTDAQNQQNQQNQVPNANDEPVTVDIVRPNAIENAAPAATTRSGRLTGPPSRFQDYVVYKSLVQIDTITPLTEMMSPVAFGATNDPDVLYFHEAMQAPDEDKFVTAMQEEIDGQTKNGNWVIVHKSTIPVDARILPAVWAMRRKRKVLDGTIYKWKVRLNVDGGKQVYGLDYWETYAPVTSWGTIRTILILSIINKWTVRQLDFVQAYPQAPIQNEMYMAIPKGFVVGQDTNSYVLKLLRNIYGQKQAGRVWNEYLTAGLIEIGFTQSKYDMCLLWKGQTILVIYTDDTIVTGPCPKEIQENVRLISEKFTITTSNGIEDFLGVNINYDNENNCIQFTQPQLIKSIIQDLGLTELKAKGHHTPAVSDEILHAYEGSTPHSEPWSYRSVIGKLNYLEKSSRPDISYAVHQCARFCENPKVEHSAAVKRIGRYLLYTKDRGIVCHPDDSSITCYSDASFLVEWEKTRSEDPITARSRSGYVLMYARCPIIWSSRLQTEIAHSATEAEYISLSHSLKEVTALMYLLQELKTQTSTSTLPFLKCTAKRMRTT